jgi:hypothetical protein
MFIFALTSLGQTKASELFMAGIWYVCYPVSFINDSDTDEHNQLHGRCNDLCGWKQGYELIELKDQGVVGS